jgi:ribosomal protein S6
MTKKKQNCHYELLCLLNEKEKNQEKYKQMIESIEKVLGKDKLEKIEEKNWKPAYRISQILTATYLLIYFKAEREKVQELKKNILKTTPKNFLDRYLLLNLTDESKLKINKYKKEKEDAEQN